MITKFWTLTISSDKLGVIGSLEHVVDKDEIFLIVTHHHHFLPVRWMQISIS